MKFVVPIYSARSYTTGKYSILKDGNFKLHHARLNKGDAIAVPLKNDDLEYAILQGWFDDYDVVLMDYGINAADTRQRFWSVARNKDIVKLYSSTHLVVVDIHSPPVKDFVYNATVMKIHGYDRPYVDANWENDLQTIERSMLTAVLRPYNVTSVMKDRPDLVKKLSLVEAVATPTHFDSIYPADDTKAPSKDFVFFPVRVSDPSYHFEQVRKGWKGHTVVITDPNDSYQYEDGDNVEISKMDKEAYCAALSNKPIIPYFVDPLIEFHTCICDFQYYGCTIDAPWDNIDYPSLDRLMRDSSKEFHYV